MNKIIKWMTIAAASMPLLSFAQFGPGPVGGQAAPVRSFEDILVVLDRAIGWFQAILFVIAVILILYAAYLFIMSAGDPAKAGQARSVLVYAAVGIGVALLAYAVEPIVRQLLGA